MTNPLDTIARWTPPKEGVPIPKPSKFARITKKAAQRAEVETFKKDAAKSERGKVSKKFRRMIFDRDGWKCVKCGADPKTDPTVRLVLAHVIPVIQEGETTEENCQCWCFDCNSGQGAARVQTEAEKQAAYEWRNRKGSAIVDQLAEVVGKKKRKA